MKNSNKTLRLSRIAILFSVSMQSIIEKLSKNGIHIEFNPNARITEDQYLILKKYFPNSQFENPFNKIKEQITFHSFKKIIIEEGRTCSICGMYEWCGTDSCPNDPT